MWKILDSIDDKQVIFNIVKQMVATTYEKYCHSSFNVSNENFLTTTGKWKILFKDNEIIGGLIYKEYFGQKLRVLFHDGCKESKAEVMCKLQLDLFDGHWVEASGKVRTKIKNVVPNVSVAFAESNFDEVCRVDNYSYSRPIDGVYSKIQTILGTPRI